MRPDKKTGARIKRRRLELGLSQRDVTKGLYRVSYAYLSRIEAGARTPSLSSLIAIAGRLKTTALQLATGRQDGRCPFCGRSDNEQVIDMLERRFDENDEDLLAARMILRGGAR